MTNKELIDLLSGFSMKSEVEVMQGDLNLAIEDIKRIYIPESDPKDGHGRKIPARNIVQIVLKK